jgi:uncharacterized OsmC-like protein
MSRVQRIKSVSERVVKALSLRPAIGQGTAVTSVRVRPGTTTVDIVDGSWQLVSDADPDQGGEGAGPDPGVLVRSGLGACMAIGYRLWAARMDVELDEIEVTVEADYDARGMYGIGDVAAGWGAVRVRIGIASSAPEERVREVVEAADSHSPILDDMMRALAVGREIHVTRKDG